MSSKRFRLYQSSSPFWVLSTFSACVLAFCLVGCNQQTKEITHSTSTEAVTAAVGVPKLVDLGATACIPCKKMAPILEELDVQYAGVLDVEFVDVWESQNKQIAKNYGVSEIPTQIFLDAGGDELWRHVGFIPKADILAKWSELGYDLQPNE